MFTAKNGEVMGLKLCSVLICHVVIGVYFLYKIITQGCI